MFDRSFFIGGGHETHAHHTTIEENRAPTDESVRILMELEQAARNKIDASYRLNDNGFECVIQLFYEPETGDTHARVIFSLNGRKCEANHTHRQWDDIAAFGKAVHKAVSDRIAEECLTELTARVHRDASYLLARKGGA
jgi:hypothetical protein